jgi:hypothetical protein
MDSPVVFGYNRGDQQNRNRSQELLFCELTNVRVYGRV